CWELAPRTGDGEGTEKATCKFPALAKTLRGRRIAECDSAPSQTLGVAHKWCALPALASLLLGAAGELSTRARLEQADPQSHWASARLPMQSGKLAEASFAALRTNIFIPP
ncbi:unnamed protein product, partial [Effrenium voratum]